MIMFCNDFYSNSEAVVMDGCSQRQDRLTVKLCMNSSDFKPSLLKARVSQHSQASLEITVLHTSLNTSVVSA